MSIHVAITRRVRPGCEDAFAQGLREFFQVSYGHPGVAGALMITPAPGSALREYGILRSFASAAERDDFYRSPLFQAWEERARTLTVGEPVYRELHGLEAWFRSPTLPPPRWKMAVATYLGVFPLATTLSLTLAPRLKALNPVAANAVFNACIVVLLTWLVMPVVTRLLRGWLHPTQGNPADEP